jgi:hypothetical protein
VTQREEAERYGRYLSSRCLSSHDGCACHEPKGHGGRHCCGDPDCGHGWDSEEARQWLAELRAAPSGAPERIYTRYVLCREPACEGHMMRVMNPRLEHYHLEGSPNWWLERTRDGEPS